jgi:hypothetical protein
LHGLLATVRRVLDDRFGCRQEITRIDRRPSAYRTSYPIDELDVAILDGTVVRMLMKDLGRHRLTEDVRRAKPDFLDDPLREIAVYRDLLTAAGLGTAAFYGTDIDPVAGYYRLFIERVTGVELYQVGDFDVWRHVARWLARFHHASAAWTGHDRLIRCDGDYYQMWMQRAVQFTRNPDVERLAGRYAEVVDRLLALPVTMVHGEFYASNVLVDPQPGGVRVCPVDWEVAGAGPGLIDLAALTAGQWSDSQRAALAAAYADAAGTDDVSADLAYCRLHLAVQWLGWSPDWSPPAEHAHDWLGEARCLARALGLLP